jgi:hypothetical protein
MASVHTKHYLISIVCLLLPIILPAQPATQRLHHALEVRLTPNLATLEVTDDITLPQARREFDFLLHDGLNPQLITPGASLSPLRHYSGTVPVRGYRVRFEQPQQKVTLVYSGKIEHPLQTLSQGYTGGRSTTPGTISDQGVFLAGSSYWYPQPVSGDRLLSFSVRTHLPEGWLAVSQGRRDPEGHTWQESQPQDEIYLIAGRFHRYQRETPVAMAEVYLSKPDPTLARRYLDATAPYLALYSRLIGPYPYAKFALVENFWESGYGMPSFTLLGPRVIRLPFILHSSYPHEILHNWWGNGVYVDYQSGNWSEGLTSYLADHLIREQQGQGADYRRDALQRYADFVAEEEDFPLTEFRGNQGEISQAVGYGKTLMFLHMLRRNLGDRQFLQGVQRFYRENLFQSAGFDDLKLALEEASGKPLEADFNQWTRRTGAPTLELKKVTLERMGAGYRVTGRLRQTQKAAPFQLRVPLFLQLEGEAVARLYELEMEERELLLEIPAGKRPLRLSVDPRFDLFRRLDPSEIPPSLGQLFGAKVLTIVLPRRAPAALRQAYEQLAEKWSRGKREIQVRWDDTREALPDSGAIWLFGTENRFTAEMIHSLPGRPLDLQRGLLSLGGRSYPLEQYSFALAGTLNDQPSGLLALSSAEVVAGLARKLPHYGKYSYLLFEGSAPTNRLKGRWEVSKSALTINLTDSEQIPPLVVPKEKPLSRSLPGNGEPTSSAKTGVTQLVPWSPIPVTSQ